MKNVVVSALLLVASMVLCTPAMAKTLAYPSEKGSSFLLDYPAGWEVKPASGEGDYLNLDGPKGVALQLRTIPGNQEAMSQAITESLNFLKENFTEPALVDVKTIQHNGMATSFTEAKGIDADGKPKRILMYFIAIDDDTIAEIWCAALKDDAEGQAAAKKIIDSFRKP